MSKELIPISKVTSLTRANIKNVFTYMGNLDPKDLAIYILANDVDKKLNQLAKDHLDSCTECETYINSEGTLGMKKSETNTRVWDEENPIIKKATLALDKAKANLAKAKDKVPPTHSVTTYRWLKTKI